MNKKRLIVTSVVSIVLVAILMIGTTYSIFTSSDVDESANVYTTGNLDVTYTLSEDNIKLEDSVPKSESAAMSLVPYRITVTNVGTVPYMFDLILNETTAGEVIDYHYIMTKVGKLETKALIECTDNVLKEDVIVPANSSVIIDVRVWISDTVSNDEIGKSFYAKLSIDGVAVYDNSTDIDNSVLIAEISSYDEEIVLLSSVEVGSYVSFLGTNGCSNYSCIGRNANYSSDTDMGYCGSSTYKYTVNGWRVGYVSDSKAYLVSAGAPECMCSNQDESTGTITSSSTSCSTAIDMNQGITQHFTNLDTAALKYCNPDYATGGVCNSTTTWAIDSDDYEMMTGKTLGSDLNSYENSCSYTSSAECGLGNTLIDNGSYYWYNALENYSSGTYPYGWDPKNLYVNSFLSSAVAGVRPILSLDADVQVIGGDGTYENPYRIATSETKVIDLSGNGNHGINRGATLDRTNGTVTTDGSTTFVDAGFTNYEFGDDITLVTRIKFNSLDTSKSVEFFNNYESGGVGLIVYQGALTLQIHANGEYKAFVSTFTPVVDTWYTFVGIYDGTSLALYSNGELLTCVTDDDDWTTNVLTGNITATIAPFAIGGNPSKYGTITTNDSVYGADAIWDDVLIFDRALTASEVAENYSGEINVVDDTDLLLYYTFE